MAEIVRYSLNNKYRLPDGYIPVTYIESDGNSWIDTGIKGHMNYKYLIDFANTNNGYNSTSYGLKRFWGVFGQSSETSGLNMSITYYYTSRAIRWESRSGKAAFVNNSKFGAITDLNINRVIIDNGDILWNGESFGKSEGHSDSCIINYNIFLFTANPGGNTPSSNAYMTLYAYKVWDNNGKLIQDMQPCLYNESYGLYDLVSNSFYENKGSGTLKGGPELVCLPFEYQRVPFLLTNPYTKINTGIIWDLNVRLDYYIRRLANTTAAIYCAIPANASTPSAFYIQAMALSSSSNTNNNWYFGTKLPSSRPVLQVYVSNHVIHDKNKVKINNSEISYSDTSVSAMSTPSNDHYIWLFYSGSMYVGPYAKLEEFKIYKSEVLVRHFVPCLEKSTGFIGLYDLVNKSFYGNEGSYNTRLNTDPYYILAPIRDKELIEYNQASPINTQTIISNSEIRNELSEEYKQVEYILNTKYCYINTNCKLTQKFKIEVKAQTSGFSSDSRIFGLGADNTVKSIMLGYVENKLKTKYSNLTTQSDNLDSQGNVITDDYKPHIYTLVGTSENTYTQVDGITTSSSGVNSSSIYTSRYLGLFTNIVSGTTCGDKLTDYFFGKIYYCKIYNDKDELVRDLVPCCRIADNVPGLFDFVGQVFYERVSAYVRFGELIYGPEITKRTNKYYNVAIPVNIRSSEDTPRNRNYSGYFNNSYLQILNLPEFTDSISISFWMKPSSNTTNQYIFSYRGSNDGDLSLILLSDGTIRFDAGCQTIFTNYTYTTQWQHIVITYNSFYKILYVNGVFLLLIACTNAINTTAIEGTIGMSSINSVDGESDAYMGYLSDFRIFDTALTLDEITKLYNN